MERETELSFAPSAPMPAEHSSPLAEKQRCGAGTLSRDLLEEQREPLLRIEAPDNLSFGVFEEAITESCNPEPPLRIIFEELPASSELNQRSEERRVQLTSTLFPEVLREGTRAAI